MEHRDRSSISESGFDQHALTTLREHLASLSLGGGSEATVTAGHVDLAPDVWLSADPAGKCTMSCLPGEGGFRLRLEEADSGGWACLGMRFRPEALAGTRYLGLLAALSAGDMISFTPTLRYLFDEGMRDDPAAEPVFLMGSGPAFLAHIPVDVAALETATGCELNLFFHNNSFTVTFTALELLRIV